MELKYVLMAKTKETKETEKEIRKEEKWTLIHVLKCART